MNYCVTNPKRQLQKKLNAVYELNFPNSCSLQFCLCELKPVDVSSFVIGKANHEKDDWINGEKTEDVVAFLDRLYTAKRTVEKRIAVLGGEPEPVASLHCSYAKLADWVA